MKQAESRANFFLSIASELVKPDQDWASKYKITSTETAKSRGTNYVSLGSEEQLTFIPRPRIIRAAGTTLTEGILKTFNGEQCNPCSFQSFPFDINKKSRTCQICNYEMR
jgi:hypothetical protein